MHGGRGSGKSWTVARVLLLQGAARPLRWGCFREVQDSIRDSVHRLLSDQIEHLGLGGFYEITRDEIRGRNGSLFVFAGLSTQTVESIKSFEGLDGAWIEEAQVVSKRSWDVLTPTIRKPNAEIWSTLNPHLETDETYQRLIAYPPTDSLVLRVNWRDNPWFHETSLPQERLDFQKRDPDNYPNIWEGEPLRVAEGAIYRHEMEAVYTSGRVRDVPHDPLLKVHTVWDLGWNDAMAIGLFQRAASELRCIDYIENTHQTLDWYVREIEKRPFRWGMDFLPHDGGARNYQTGKSTEEALRAMGRIPKVLPNLPVEEGIKAARMVLPRTYFDAEKAKRLLECLKRYRRIVNKAGEPMGPLHDQFSHGADMFRQAALSVENMTNFEEAPSYEPEAYDD
jgi:phage terminase large subunit